MDCKYYQDDFCVNAASPCVADWCPCAQYPEICRYYQGEKFFTAPTYEELYKHWLKTKDKPKRKRKDEPLPGQLDLFNVIDNKTK